MGWWLDTAGAVSAPAAPCCLWSIVPCHQPALSLDLKPFAIVLSMNSGNDTRGGRQNPNGDTQKVTGGTPRPLCALGWGSSCFFPSGTSEMCFPETAFLWRSSSNATDTQSHGPCSGHELWKCSGTCGHPPGLCVRRRTRSRASCLVTGAGPSLCFGGPPPTQHRVRAPTCWLAFRCTSLPALTCFTRNYTSQLTSLS